MKRCMKMTVAAVLLGGIALFSTGCQDEQLENCQQEKLKLQETIDQQQKEIKQAALLQDTFTELLMQVTAESAKLEKELAATEEELVKAKKLKKMREMSPEKKAKMIKSLEELKKARDIKAEKMRKKQQEKK